VLIDLIFCPSGFELTHEVFVRAEMMSVMAVSMPVMALEDALVTMLYALDEHTLDYSRLLAIARALREQINWEALRVRASPSPYARALLTLVEELGVAPRSGRAGRQPTEVGPSQAHGRVRVLGATD
jgi:hypothetical protein